MYYLQNPTPPEHNPLCSTTFPSILNLHSTNLSGAVTNLGGLAAAGTALVHLARVVGVVTAVLDRGGIAVVGVDARELTSILGDHALDVHVTLALGGALFAVSVNHPT